MAVKAKNKTSKKTKKAKSSPRAKKVWYIFQFKERFELPDDVRFCRRGPLQFVREYVGSGQTDVSITYKQQLEAVKTSPNRHILRSIFDDLREIAANRSRCYRGYLLDEKNQPATEKKIAQWVGLEPSECRRVLKELADIGLIERVPLPEFDITENEIPRKSKRRSDRSRKPGSRGGKKRGKGKSSSAHEPARASSSAFTETVNGNGNGNNKGNKKQTAKPLSNGGINQERTSGRDMRGQGVMREEIPTAPTTTPLFSPTGSDAGVGHRSLDSSVPDLPRSVLTPPPKYGDEAKQFGFEIFKALRVQHNPTSPEGRRELGGFASAWQTAQISGISSLNELWQASVQDATRIGLKRGRTRWRKGPEATWRWLFNKRLEALKARSSAVKAG